MCLVSSLQNQACWQKLLYQGYRRPLTLISTLAKLFVVGCLLDDVQYCRSKLHATMIP